MIETFPIVPGQVRMLWVIGPLLLVILIPGVLLVLTLRGSRDARFEVSAAGLRLRGDMYGRMIPAAALRVDDARAVDLNVDRSLAPAVRTGGTALPGYRAGWFRLRSGERALLYLTDQSHVAYVPTREGYSVLVSVADPPAFVAALRRSTSPTPPP